MKLITEIPGPMYHRLVGNLSKCKETYAMKLRMHMRDRLMYYESYMIQSSIEKGYYETK